MILILGSELALTSFLFKVRLIHLEALRSHIILNRIRNPVPNNFKFAQLLIAVASFRSLDACLRIVNMHLPHDDIFSMKKPYLTILVLKEVCVHVH